MDNTLYNWTYPWWLISTHLLLNQLILELPGDTKCWLRRQVDIPPLLHWGNYNLNKTSVLTMKTNSNYGRHYDSTTELIWCILATEYRQCHRTLPDWTKTLYSYEDYTASPLWIISVSTDLFQSDCYWTSYNCTIRSTAWPNLTSHSRTQVDTRSTNLISTQK